MRYVQTSKGAFVRHILNEFENIRWDDTHKTSVRKLSEDERKQFGVFQLQLVTPPAFNPASQARGEVEPLLVSDVWTQNWVVTDLGGDVLAEAQAEASAKAAKDSKITGIEILGVMCSATKEDQMGLTAIGLDYSMTASAGDKFESTKFEFANGNSLVITHDNFLSIYGIWVPFRKSFFLP